MIQEPYFYNVKKRVLGSARSACDERLAGLYCFKMEPSGVRRVHSETAARIVMPKVTGLPG